MRVLALIISSTCVLASSDLTHPFSYPDRTPTLSNHRVLEISRPFDSLRKSLSRRGLPKKTSCGGPLQKRGQCLAKPPDERGAPQQQQRQPVQQQSGSSPSSIATPSRQSSGRQSNSAETTPRRERQTNIRPLMTTPQQSQASTSGPRQVSTPSSSRTDQDDVNIPRSGGGQRNARRPPRSNANLGQAPQRFGNTPDSTTMHRVGRGIRSATHELFHPWHPTGFPNWPRINVKMTGPGMMEMERLTGFPRGATLADGQRDFDSASDLRSVSGTTFTDGGGKSSIRGSGQRVTANVNKYGEGKATVRIKEPGSSRRIKIGADAVGMQTFSATSHDPENPVKIKVKAAGAVHTTVIAHSRAMSDL